MVNTGQTGRMKTPLHSVGYMNLKWNQAVKKIPDYRTQTACDSNTNTGLGLKIGNCLKSFAHYVHIKLDLS